MCHERRDKNDAASFRQDRKELLDKKEGRPNVDAEESVEVFDGCFLNGRCFRDSCIGDQDVEAITDDAPGLFGELMRTIRGGEINR